VNLRNSRNSKPQNAKQDGISLDEPHVVELVKPLNPSLFFFFVALTPRVERCKSLSLKYEP